MKDRKLNKSYDDINNSIMTISSKTRNIFAMNQDKIGKIRKLIVIKNNLSHILLYFSKN